MDLATYDAKGVLDLSTSEGKRHDHFGKVRLVPVPGSLNSEPPRGLTGSMYALPVSLGGFDTPPRGGACCSGAVFRIPGLLDLETWQQLSIHQGAYHRQEASR